MVALREEILEVLGKFGFLPVRKGLINRKIYELRKIEEEDPLLGETIGRQLRFMAKEGVIEVSYKNGCAHYNRRNFSSPSTWRKNVWGAHI